MKVSVGRFATGIPERSSGIIELPRHEIVIDLLLFVHEPLREPIELLHRPERILAAFDTALSHYDVGDFADPSLAPAHVRITDLPDAHTYPVGAF